MNADIDHSRSSRRPIPEVAVYRPGSGPLKKSSSNVENIQPSSSSQSTGRSDMESGLASHFRNVNLNDESHRVNDRTSEAHTQEPKTRKTSNQRHDKNPSKPRTENRQHLNVGEKKDEPRDISASSKQGKRQLHHPEKADTGSSQDLRQLLIEKRLQRNNESPSVSLQSESHPSTAQPSNGKQKSDNRHERQSTKAREEMNNGHHSGPVPSNNVPQPLSIDASSSGLTRNSDKRHSARRRNDRKHRVENSHSEGHLAALTNNNSPAANLPSRNVEDRKANTVNDEEKSRNGRERREGKVHYS